MWMIVSAPTHAESGSITPIMILYHLHCADKDATIFGQIRRSFSIESLPAV